jgi:hypothetical protein
MVAYGVEAILVAGSVTKDVFKIWTGGNVNVVGPIHAEWLAMIPRTGRTRQSKHKAKSNRESISQRTRAIILDYMAYGKLTLNGTCVRAWDC